MWAILLKENIVIFLVVDHHDPNSRRQVIPVVSQTDDVAQTLMPCEWTPWHMLDNVTTDVTLILFRLNKLQCFVVKRLMKTLAHIWVGFPSFILLIYLFGVFRLLSCYTFWFFCQVLMDDMTESWRIWPWFIDHISGDCGFAVLHMRVLTLPCILIVLSEYWHRIWPLSMF